MKIKKSLMLFLVLGLFVPSAFSWCVLGVGNTCGSDSTDSSSSGFFSKYVVNFDKPKASSSVSFWGLGRSSSIDFGKSSSSSNTASDNEGDSTDVRDDSGNSYKITTTKRTSTVKTSRGELAPALFYDVDVINANFQCLNCLVINGETILSGGFNYQLDLDLINDGNIETTKPIGLEIEIQTPEGTEVIEFNRNALYLPAGNFELSIPIESFGVEGGKLKDEYILGLTSDVVDIPIKVNVRIFNDYGVPEPRIQQITKTKRVCSGTGEFRSCEDIVTYEEKETCPDGSNYGGLTSCENPKGDNGNNLDREFNIIRISPDVLGNSRFGFIRK